MGRARECAQQAVVTGERRCNKVVGIFDFGKTADHLYALGSRAKGASGARIGTAGMVSKLPRRDRVAMCDSVVGRPPPSIVRNTHPPPAALVL
eukprot:4761797-Pyramimonas_sp.AAC.1